MAAESPTKTYTVSELTAGIRAALERPFARICLEGEVSGWRVYPSGHAYFTLKDANAQISAVMFASYLNRSETKHPGIRDRLRDGAKVVAFGSVTVYGPRGQYQLSVYALKLAGVGELMQRYLELKARLEREGLFDAARKRPLPYLPRRIGIVSSPAGAVIHDMCTVLARRFPALEIRLCPCLVQGEAAPPTIVAGLEYFNAHVPDLVIVARGGGSFEDLFCFNDESVVRAVAASKAPVISAVGHETDYTLCDFAADRRAGTPSIAAEIAVPVRDELLKRVRDASARLTSLLRERGQFSAQRTDQLADALAASLRLALARAERCVEGLAPRLSPALALTLQRVEGRLATAAARLAAYSPYGVLERGYSLTTTASGAVVRDAAQLKGGDVLVTRFAQGEARSRVI